MSVANAHAQQSHCNNTTTQKRKNNKKTCSIETTAQEKEKSNGVVAIRNQFKNAGITWIHSAGEHAQILIYIHTYVHVSMLHVVLR